MRLRESAALLATLCTLLLTACAHVEAPTGGEEDREPPQLIGVRPDSLATVAPSREPVAFVFDERLSEQGIDNAVMVSPRTSPIQVSRRGNELRVNLRGGWEPDRIYHVTLRPTLQDLFNNRLQQAIQLVFSTGPEIPETLLTGTVIDRITGRPELDVRVEAIRRADSLVYAFPTDSAGRFSLGRIPTGDYQVRAYRDLNRDRALDSFEPRDTASATVAAGESVNVELSLVMPDTTPPAVASASVGRGGMIELLFDDHLDPQQVISPEQVSITAPDGTVVPVSRVAVGRLEPRADEAGLEVDTVAAPAPPAQPARPPAGRQAQGPEEGLPSQTLVVEPATPLAPGTEYRIRVDGVRNIVGLIGGGEATFTTAAAPPP